jgi:hypothetical protein
VRLSFVSPDRDRYRHVLLVYPTRTKQGKPTYRAVNSHAGGIAWYGNYLYVAETQRGVRVFDLRKIFDLGLSKNGTTRNRKRIGLKGKTYYGAGNRYVLPQLTYYGNVATQPKRSCTGSHGTHWFTYNVTFPKGQANRGGLMSVDWTAAGVWHGRDDIKISKALRTCRVGDQTTGCGRLPSMQNIERSTAWRDTRCR